MENYNNRLLTQQAYESTLKNKEEVRKVKAERFEKLSIGCILYALFYTVCLYKNYAGITHPFFVGGTLYFFGYFQGRQFVAEMLFLIVAHTFSYVHWLFIAWVGIREHPFVKMPTVALTVHHFAVIIFFFRTLGNNQRRVT